MERTAFANQQPRPSLSHPEIFSSSPPPLSHREDPIESIEHDINDEEEEEREASLSGSGLNSSGPDEAVFDDIINTTRQSSPGTSHHSEDEISDLPLESRAGSYAPEHKTSSTCSPGKTRSPFRNPSSIRAMQLETTPPPYFVSSSSQHRYKLDASSRNSTPRSMRSYHSAVRSPSKLSPAKKVKKEYPLVLLHVTILPIVMPYSQETMESTVPGYVMENWKLLRERVADTVLERGILIPHPREDYDLLEERMLESLELKTPRILRCGHFYLDLDEADDIAASEADEYDSDNDIDICGDCGRRIRDGRHGSGTGQRRWDIKIYAANGLMRAGAWGAAWSEMERVDVEILPWIEDDLRRELDLRSEEQRQAPPIDHSAHSHQGMAEANRMDDARIREIYGEDARAYIHRSRDDQLRPDGKVETFEALYQSGTQQDIPIWTLLQNYAYVAAQDRRNIAILLLSMLVLFLSIGSRSTSSSPSKLQTQIMPAPITILTETNPSITASGVSSSILNDVTPEYTILATSSKDVHEEDLIEQITGDI